MDEKVLYKRTNTQDEVMLDEIYSSADEKGLLTLIAFRAFIRENCDLKALEETWNALVRANDALRLRAADKKAKQMYIAPYEHETLKVEHADGEEGFDRFADELKKHPVPLAQDAPMYSAVIVDCGNGQGGMVVRLHHLCCDGYSIELMFRQFEKCYPAICAGEEPEIKAGSITAFFRSQEEYLKSEEYRKDLGWWKKTYRQQKHFSIPGPRPSTDGRVGEKEYVIENDRYDRLKALCTACKCTVPTAVMTAASLATKEITGKTNFSIHMLTHGRTTYPLRQTVGCMVRTIPVFLDRTGECSFAECVKKDCANYLDSMRHCRIPYRDHMKLCYWKSVFAGFNFFHNWLTISAMGLGKVSAESELGLYALPKTLLSSLIYCAVYDIPEEGMIRLGMVWQKARFTEEQMNGIMKTFFEILDNGLKETELN